MSLKDLITGIGGRSARGVPVPRFGQQALPVYLPPPAPPQEHILQMAPDDHADIELHVRVPYSIVVDVVKFVCEKVSQFPRVSQSGSP